MFHSKKESLCRETKRLLLLIIRFTRSNYLEIRLFLILLSLGKLRKKPAIRRFDWSFAAIVKSYEQFAR